MSRLFEELDYRPTPIGAISLRRRREARLGVDVLEIKLGDEHLMSDLFTASEIALADLGIAACKGDALDVVVGGLGLGYTAKAVLDRTRTGSLIVVEYLEAVIDWHRTGLLPLGSELTTDARCRLVEGDFFALARGGAGFDPDSPGRRFDAILLDIDHSPEALLDERSESFYQPEGLKLLARHLKSGGVFGLWSDDREDPGFVARLAQVFDEAWSEPVTFHNPLQDKPFTQTIYLARKG
jgi:spermidine synthase